MDDTGDPPTLTRARFRELIDPLLSGLGFAAEQVVSCSFDAHGFTLVLFHEDEEGHRVAGRYHGGGPRYSGYAKVNVVVPVDPSVPRTPER